MTTVIQPIFTKQDIYKVLCWLAIFFAIYIGVALAIVYLNLLEVKTVPESLISSSFWDIDRVILAAGWMIAYNWWLFGIALLAGVVATKSLKYLFKEKK